MELDNEIQTEELLGSSEPLNDERIVRRRTRRTGEAVSRLCSSWLRAGADVLVGSIDIAGDVSRDLTGEYCDRDSRRRPRR